jgi:hypothetical protein
MWCLQQEEAERRVIRALPFSVRRHPRFVVISLYLRTYLPPFTRIAPISPLISAAVQGIDASANRCRV